MDGFAVYGTPLGFFRIEYKVGYITYLNKLHTDQVTDYDTKIPLTDQVYSELTEFFEGRRKTFTFPYILKGTDFQKKVWQALCEIPYGETRSYKEVAAAVGNDKASRAVGLANNRNPIIVAVPCHRVIGADGKLVGYGGGLDMKVKLLEVERDNK